MQCTEKERRDIIRSDIEFIYIMKQHIILRLRLNTDKEGRIPEELERQIYGEHWIPTPLKDIPKIPRGKELIWSNVGDPIPQQTKNEKKRTEILNEVILKVWDNVEVLYPEIYAKSWPVYVQKVEAGEMRLMINSAHEKDNKVLMHARRGPKFYSVAIPWLSYAIVDIISRICGDIDDGTKKAMYQKIVRTTWEKIVVLSREGE
jgi:hypothetical protein